MSEKCGQFAEALISGYLDGVIGPSDRRRVRVHVQRCADCRGLLRDLREVRDTLLSTRRYLHLPGSLPAAIVGAGHAPH